MNFNLYNKIISKLNNENYKQFKVFSLKTEINNLNFIINELNKICLSLDINEASERYIDCKKLIEYIFYEWGCKILNLDNIYIDDPQNLNPKKIKNLFDCKNLNIFEEKIKSEIKERINSCSDDLPEYTSNNDSINFSELCRESVKHYQKCFSEDFVYQGTGIHIVFKSKSNYEEESIKEKINFLAAFKEVLEDFIEVIKDTPGITIELIKRFIRFLNKNKRISRAESKSLLKKELDKRIEDDLIPELLNLYEDRKNNFKSIFNNFMEFFLYQLGLINTAISNKDIKELDSMSKKYINLLSEIQLLKNEYQE